jgi:hypothetical protein
MAKVDLRAGGQPNVRLLHGPPVPPLVQVSPERLESYAKERRISPEQVANEAYFGATNDDDKLAALRYLASQHARTTTPHDTSTMGVVEGRTQNQATFIDALGHPRIEAREIAVEVLGKTGNLAELDALVGSAITEVDPTLRRRVVALAIEATLDFSKRAHVQRLSTSDGPFSAQAAPGYATIDKLVGLSRDADPEVRSLSEKMLGDPRFHPLLLSLAPVRLDAPMWLGLVKHVADASQGQFEAWVRSAASAPSSLIRESSTTIADIALRFFDHRGAEALDTLAASFSRYFDGGEPTIRLLDDKGVRTERFFTGLLESSYPMGHRGHSPLESAKEALAKWAQELGPEGYERRLVEVLDRRAEKSYRGSSASAEEIGAIHQLHTMGRLGPQLDRLLTDDRFSSFYSSTKDHQAWEIWKGMIGSAFASLDASAQATLNEKHWMTLGRLGVKAGLPDSMRPRQTVTPPATMTSWIAAFRKLL